MTNHRKRTVWEISSKKKYNIIYADPPWKYGCVEGIPYKTIPIRDINCFPIQKITADNCALFLWVPYMILPKCIETLKQWGFRYVTVAFTWVKISRKKGTPLLGRGGWVRANAEVCLMGLKGKLKRESTNVSQIVLSPLREHSRKPDEVRERIVKLMGNLPRIELFARQTVKGWDCWGNETEKFNEGIKDGE